MELFCQPNKEVKIKFEYPHFELHNGLMVACIIQKDNQLLHVSYMPPTKKLDPKLYLNLIKSIIPLPVNRKYRRTG